MRRLVAIELKLGRFTPANKGQMELYLRWLDENERRKGENTPVGLILCTEHDDEQIRLLRLNKGEIRVADYLTQLLPKPLLEEKLNKAIRIGKERFAIERNKQE